MPLRVSNPPKHRGGVVSSSGSALSLPPGQSIGRAHTSPLPAAGAGMTSQPPRTHSPQHHHYFCASLGSCYVSAFTTNHRLTENNSLISQLSIVDISDQSLGTLSWASTHSQVSTQVPCASWAQSM